MNLVAACKAFLDTAFPKRSEARRLKAAFALAQADWLSAKRLHNDAERRGDTREMGRAYMDMLRANRRQLIASTNLRALEGVPGVARLRLEEGRG